MGSTVAAMTVMFRRLLLTPLIVLVASVAVTGWFAHRAAADRGLDSRDVVAIGRVLVHHAAEVDVVSVQRGLPPSYFKALIILESRGRRSAGARFEPQVFERLKQVRDGPRRQMEAITHSTVGNASDNALRNLATSWGPLQVMGYHCVEVGILVRDLREAESLRWSIVWIDQTYGGYLRRGEYRDAFHLHNTGRPFPKNGVPRTHDPTYVDRGLRYIDAFEWIDRLSERTRARFAAYRGAHK